MADAKDGPTVDDLTDREVQEMEAGEEFEFADGQAPANEDDSDAKDAAEVSEEAAGEAPGDEDKEKAQEEPKAPVLDARLRHAAERAGWADEDIANLGDKAPAILEKFADGFDAVATRMSEIGRAQAADGDKGERKTASETTEEAFDIHTPLDRAGLLEKKDEDDEPIFSEEALGVLTPIFDAFESMRGVVAQLHDRVTPYVDAQEQASQTKDFEVLEEFFEEVKADYGEVFGEGKSADLGEKSEEMKARQALWEQAKLIAAGCEATGRKFDLKDVLKQALSVTQAGRQKELARKELNKDLKKRARQITPRAQGRAAKAVDPEEAAVDAITGIVKELGIKP